MKNPKHPSSKPSASSKPPASAKPSASSKQPASANPSASSKTPASANPSAGMAARKSRWGPPPTGAAAGPAGEKGASTSRRTPTPTRSSRRHPAPNPTAPAPLARNPASPAAAIRPQPPVETPPPPQYGFNNLDRRTMLLADGTVRTYFALPPDYLFEPAPLPPLVHIPRHAGPEAWPPHQPPSQQQFPPQQQFLPHDAKRKHHADPDEGFSRYPKQPRFEAPPHHPSQMPPQVDRQAVRKAFLKYSKMLNENTAQKRSYLEGGRVQCLPCGRFGDSAPLVTFFMGSVLVQIVVRFLCWFLSIVELVLML